MARGDLFGTSKKALKQRVQAQEMALQSTNPSQSVPSGQIVPVPPLATMGNLPAPNQQMNTLLAAAAVNNQGTSTSLQHHAGHIMPVTSAQAGGQSFIQIQQNPPEVTIRQSPPQISVLHQQAPTTYQVSAPAQNYTASIALPSLPANQTSIAPVTQIPVTTMSVPTMPITPMPITPLPVTTIPVNATSMTTPTIGATSALLMPAAVMMQQQQQQPSTSYLLHQGFVTPQAGMVSVRAGCPLGQLYNSTTSRFLPDLLMQAGGGMSGSAHVHHHHHVCRRHR